MPMRDDAKTYLYVGRCPKEGEPCLFEVQPGAVDAYRILARFSGEASADRFMELSYKVINHGDLVAGVNAETGERYGERRIHL